MNRYFPSSSDVTVLDDLRGRPEFVQVECAGETILLHWSLAVEAVRMIEHELEGLDHEAITA